MVHGVVPGRRNPNSALYQTWLRASPVPNMVQGTLCTKYDAV